MTHTVRQRRLVLLISFLLPVLIMGGYFVYRGMAPFGSSTVLTVDLGQQYVDFFAYLRSSLLHHPSSLLYSFSKGLGGEMWGTNAYYLWSPLNLLLLFFPAQHLASGIAILTLLKYGLAGLAMAWVLDREKIQQGPRIWIFSTPYALMGWMVANQFNLLWLDVLFLLPLIIYGERKLLSGRSPWTYTLWLAVALIDNYYMAWMVAIFTILFGIWTIASEKTTWQWQWHAAGYTLGRYLGSSLLAGAISAFVLLPTTYALTQSKGTYTTTSWNWKLEYNPLKMLAKLVPGSFNFNQMPSGQPNIYVGMLIMLGAVLYFFNRREKIAGRLTAGLITLFLLASFCIEALDLFWHAGQFPVWYPYRFSYLFSFWCIWLAARTLQPDFRIKWPVALGLAVLVGSIFAYLMLKQVSHLSYINRNQLLIGLGFAAIAILALLIPRYGNSRLYDLLLILLAVCDVSTSAFTALNNISYVSQAEFGNYTKKLDKAVTKLKSLDSGLYRTGKTFMRTKDDPFQADFNSGDHFGSTLEPAQPAFMGAIGQPDGDGFITYTDGTQVTDSLLGFKYFLQERHNGKQNGSTVLPSTSLRPDLKQQKTIAQTSMVNIKSNQAALPIAFGASSQVLNLTHNTLDPLAYQSQIFQSLAGRGVNQLLFQVQNFNHVTFGNVQSAVQITGTTFKKRNLLTPASIELEFTPTTNNSYYLTLGANVKNNATITINGKALTQYDTYRNTVTVNVANHAKGKTIKIVFSLKNSTLWMQNVSLYMLNQKAFNASLKTLKQSPLKVSSYAANRISGTVNLKAGQDLLMTTIPYDQGWHVKVDGKTVTPKKALSTFMAIPMSTGKHKVSMYYIPPYLILGTTISLLAISGSIWWLKKGRQKR